MIVLDTTVLVYARGTEHPFREPCASLFDAVGEGRLEVTTTAEVIQEFVHVRSRRRERFDAVGAGSDYADLLTPLIVVRDDDLRRGLTLFERHERLGAFDAVLAAAAVGAGAQAIVSADRAFETVAGIDHVWPDAEGVAGLLTE